MFLAVVELASCAGYFLIVPLLPNPGPRPFCLAWYTGLKQQMDPSMAGP